MNIHTPQSRSTLPGLADSGTTPSCALKAAPAMRIRDRMRSVLADDTGAATAEYAVATMAAVAFAGLLVVIMRARLTNLDRARSRP